MTANGPPTVVNPIDDVTVDEDAANTVIDLGPVFGDPDWDGRYADLHRDGPACRSTAWSLRSARPATRRCTRTCCTRTPATTAVAGRSTTWRGQHLDVLRRPRAGDDAGTVRLQLADLLQRGRRPARRDAAERHVHGRRALRLGEQSRRRRQRQRHGGRDGVGPGPVAVPVRRHADVHRLRPRGAGPEGRVRLRGQPTIRRRSRAWSAWT